MVNLSKLMVPLVNTKQRSSAVEWMDDFDTEGVELRKTLDQIAGINRWLGGNKITKKGLMKLLKSTKSKEPLHLIDFGCGNGDMLRFLAKWAMKHNVEMTFCGMDANAETIRYAEELSADFPQISYLHRDVFNVNEKERACDITLSTLFLHHFKEEEIVLLLSQQLEHCRIGMVINDLHRHRSAYYLFYLVCLFIKNKRIRDDGLISVLRGFKKRELRSLSNQLKAKHQLRWKWAFRYQWILQK
ncbi:methyltransferase domain-containing protein [Flavobacteriaceae bacterium F08102]|nr:methyltransferase domain-containing protein [Flavobacteriaceae bacterium F08102]